jgi:hypothetical protein
MSTNGKWVSMLMINLVLIVFTSHRVKYLSYNRLPNANPSVNKFITYDDFLRGSTGYASTG